MADVTVVGTGAMGAPIARNLLKAGYKVAVWNRDRAKVEPLVELGATAVQDLAEVFASGVVMSVLADDEAVREVFLNSRVLDAAEQDSVHVNLATISPDLAEETATAHAQRAVGYLAAPMFGGVPVAEAGRLNIVTAGHAAVQERMRPLLEAISAGIWAVGEQPRQANVVKVAGQLVIASAIQTLSEAVSMAERDGVEGSRLVEILTSTVTPGPVYTRYGGLIVDRKYEPAGFTPALGRKDVDLARAQAGLTGLRLPIGDLLSSLLTDAIEAGHEQQDWAALAEVQRHRGLLARR
ncbi:NAD(P)-dependent oxidoreductase [Arthrobacter sp. SX1312]|uniref:NAD(P)-dependent oxidoreductase n=1 Tax=Arthrobacter sp. SX1312 TaxID=2058896 RepID=UPI000CE4A356|nr:NAD(P)-dependent oxidoreductase [Arthrobacter sp. SX1312]